MNRASIQLGLEELERRIVPSVSGVHSTVQADAAKVHAAQQAFQQEDRRSAKGPRGCVGSRPMGARPRRFGPDRLAPEVQSNPEKWQTTLRLDEEAIFSASIRPAPKPPNAPTCRSRVDEEKNRIGLTAPAPDTVAWALHGWGRPVDGRSKRGLALSTAQRTWVSYSSPSVLGCD
jgi:hypothetical protein